MIKKITSDMIPYDNLIIALCKTPYHGHSKGCINYNKKDGCPPLPIINIFFDLNKELYVICTEYTLGIDAERMKKKHPEWKEREFPDHPRRTKIFLEDITNRLRQRHPEWPDGYFPRKHSHNWRSSREWYNPRYWQDPARKKHRIEIAEFQAEHPDLFIDSSPEARGINVTGMMFNIGISLNWQWPPKHDVKNKTYRVSIAGYLKE